MFFNYSPILKLCFAKFKGINESIQAAFLILNFKLSEARVLKQIGKSKYKFKEQ